MANDTVEVLLNEMPICNNISFCSSVAGEMYQTYNLAMTGCLLPAVGAFGVVANLVSVYVFSQEPLRHQSVNTYLTSLACSDVCLTLTAMFLGIFESWRHRGPRILSMIYGYGAPYVFSMGAVCQTTSIYITIAAAIDCYLRVNRIYGGGSGRPPLSNRLRRRQSVSKRFCSTRLCSTENARVVSLVIVAFAFWYNAPHWFELKSVICFDNRLNSSSLQVCPTDFRLNADYVKVYYSLMYTVVMAFGPLLLLIMLNLLIIYKLFRRQRRRRKRSRKTTTADETTTSPLTLRNRTVAKLQSPSDRKQSSDRYPPVESPKASTRSRATTWNLQPPPERDGEPCGLTRRAITGGRHEELKRTMTPEEAETEEAITLILVVFLFIACNSIAVSLNFFELFLAQEMAFVMSYLVDVSNFLVVCNCTANFLIYYRFGRTFRAVLQDHFPAVFDHSYRRRLLGVGLFGMVPVGGVTMEAVIANSVIADQLASPGSDERSEPSALHSKRSATSILAGLISGERPTPPSGSHSNIELTTAAEFRRWSERDCKRADEKSPIVKTDDQPMGNREQKPSPVRRQSPHRQRSDGTLLKTNGLLYL